MATSYVRISVRNTILRSYCVSGQRLSLVISSANPVLFRGNPSCRESVIAQMPGTIPLETQTARAKAHPVRGKGRCLCPTVSNASARILCYVQAFNLSLFIRDLPSTLVQITRYTAVIRRSMVYRRWLL